MKEKKRKLLNLLESYENIDDEILENIFIKDINTPCEVFKKVFSCCSEIIIHPLNLYKKGDCCIVYAKKLSNDALINKFILKPLFHEIQNNKNSSTFNKTIFYKLPVDHIIEISNLKEAVEHILNGYCLLLIKDKAAALNTIFTITRAVEKPSTETTLIGPQEAFVEDIETNLTLLRRRIKTSNFKTKYMEVGKISKTRIAVAYINGVSDKKVLKEVTERLSKINIDIILDSNELRKVITDMPLSPFPNEVLTERPDHCARLICDGRIAVLCNNSPFAIIVPGLFVDILSSVDEFYLQFYYGTFVRFLRYFIFAITMLGSSIYIALTCFHQEMIPAPLLITIATSRAEVPFPAIIEALLMELTFEILREASIRTPKHIGSAISIVGGLVIGQGAVEAGIVSQAMIIVVAITGISSFAIPGFNTHTSLRLIKYPFMFLASFLGIFGIIIGSLVLLIHLASKRSFGVPYLSPFSPMTLSDWKKHVIRFPIRSIKYRPLFLSGQNKKMAGD